jgi:hypothetical protein
LVAAAASAQTQDPQKRPAPKPVTRSEGALGRWLEIHSANASTRYRYLRNNRGDVLANHLQYRDAFTGRFKIDPAGDYSIHAGVFSGKRFTAVWNNVGPGTGTFTANHYLKQLYLSARPARGLELQYGGLYLSRGESSEITSYDNDGYIVGERLLLRKPAQLFFDEIAVTYGYLGDLETPNINKRFHRLKRSNYHQWLAHKRLGSRAAVSFDYTFVDGVETLRQGLRIDTPAFRIVDQIRFENYQRVDRLRDYGFAVSGEKLIRKKLTVSGGYADIDRFYGEVNGDRYFTGKRLFLLTSYRVWSDLTVGTYVTRAFGNDFVVTNGTRLDIVLTYDFLKLLQSTGIF